MRTTVFFVLAVLFVMPVLGQEKSPSEPPQAWWKAGAKAESCVMAVGRARLVNVRMLSFARRNALMRARGRLSAVWQGLAYAFMKDFAMASKAENAEALKSALMGPEVGKWLADQPLMGVESLAVHQPSNNKEVFALVGMRAPNVRLNLEACLRKACARGSSGVTLTKEDEERLKQALVTFEDKLKKEQQKFLAAHGLVKPKPKSKPTSQPESRSAGD